MAGYSGKPLVKKLGIKEGTAVLLRRAPGAGRLCQHAWTVASGSASGRQFG